MTERIGTPSSSHKNNANELVEELLREKIHQEMGPFADEVAQGLGLSREAGRYLLELLLDPGREASSSSHIQEEGREESDPYAA